MGAFFTNYQVRTNSSEPVALALPRLTTGPAVVSPPAGAWVTVYDAPSESQDLDVLHYTAQGLSRALGTSVFAFLVHDSDVLVYLLYSDGRLADEFNSCPEYFGKSDDDDAGPASGGSAGALLPYCRPGTTFEQVERLLNPETGPAFPEPGLDELADLLGIDRSRAASGFNSFASSAGHASAPDASKYIRVEGAASVKVRRPRKRRTPAAHSEEEDDPAAVARAVAKEVFGMVPADRYAAAVAMVWHARAAAAELLRPLSQPQVSDTDRASLQRVAALASASTDWSAAQLLRQSKVEGRPTIEALAAAADKGAEALADLVATATPASLDAVAETAIRSGGTALLRALLDRGARADTTPADGWTMLTLAAWNGAAGSVEVLTSRGADVNGRDARGYTPLMHAAQRGNPEAVRALLDRGADPAAHAPDGETALSLARRLGRNDPGIAELLRLELERSPG